MRCPPPVSAQLRGSGRPWTTAVLAAAGGPVPTVAREMGGSTGGRPPWGPLRMQSQGVGNEVSAPGTGPAARQRAARDRHRVSGCWRPRPDLGL
jgi:hypothetical protein